MKKKENINRVSMEDAKKEVTSERQVKMFTGGKNPREGGKHGKDENAGKALHVSSHANPIVNPIVNPIANPHASTTIEGYVLKEVTIPIIQKDEKPNVVTPSGTFNKLSYVPFSHYNFKPSQNLSDEGTAHTLRTTNIIDANNNKNEINMCSSQYAYPYGGYIPTFPQYSNDTNTQRIELYSPNENHNIGKSGTENLCNADPYFPYSPYHKGDNLSAEMGHHQMGHHQTGQHQMGQHQMGQHQMGPYQMGQHQMGQHQMGPYQSGANQPGQYPARL
ncbi:conserved Plasmodium protein, unknown function [Plasmodium ovale curtisi]|uniref:Uncharacterized protein n=1 Tax=Plasmodium ovale curtisi TaxID=864141 RepID=A0A1A8WSS6_PLAOA|nr:conserved Plasmodium protein, unknown function [Plasmodium ovale curtisi]